MVGPAHRGGPYTGESPSLTSRSARMTPRGLTLSLMVELVGEGEDQGLAIENLILAEAEWREHIPFALPGGRDHILSAPATLDRYRGSSSRARLNDDDNGASIGGPAVEQLFVDCPAQTPSPGSGPRLGPILGAAQGVCRRSQPSDCRPSCSRPFARNWTLQSE